jgi:hypothetical protein
VVAQTQVYTQFWWDKKEYIGYEVHPKNYTVEEKMDNFEYSSYNAPIYDRENKKIGNVVFVDSLVWRGEKLYVMEDCGLFFDGEGFGSTIRFLYTFLSLSGDSYYPKNTIFNFDMMYGTGLYYGKKYQIELLTGVSNRTITLTPISASTNESSNDQDGTESAYAALAISICSIVGTLGVAFFVVSATNKAPLSGSSNSNL